jgi:hypothetical protein
VRYTARTRFLQQYLVNGGFEDSLTNIWTGFATGAVARDSANAYTENYALKCTPGVTNDGFQYNLSLNLFPGRQYRVRGVAKGAAAEVLGGFWYDGSTDQSMAVVSGATLTTTFTPFEFTFTPTKSVVPNLKFKDSKASPGIFYVDNMILIDDTTGTNPMIGNNPMDAGLAVTPFTFNVIVRRASDGTTIRKYLKCAFDKQEEGSGKTYSEKLSGMFLDVITE